MHRLQVPRQPEVGRARKAQPHVAETAEVLRGLVLGGA